MTTINSNTPPRPAFTWLFLATPTGHPNVTPIVVRTEANTEDEARKRFIGWSLVFAAQIRTGTPYQVGWYDPITGMSWHVHGSSVIEDITGCCMRNMSVSDLSTLRIDPAITGRILLQVLNGRVVSSTLIPSDHIVASVDAFMELAERAGYKKMRMNRSLFKKDLRAIFWFMPKMAKRPTSENYALMNMWQRYSG